MSGLQIFLLIVVCLALVAAIAAVAVPALIARAKKTRFEKALYNPAVAFVGRFWRRSLMQETHDRNQLDEFERLIQRKLAQAYSETKKFPKIGIGWYGPRESVFGLDELLWSAMKEVGFVNGNCREVDHQRFICTWGQMNIDFERVVFKLTCVGSDKDERVVWSNASGSDEAAIAGVQVSLY